MKPKTWVEISRSALLHNVGQFLSLLPRSVQFMAVVKSNAYGHGLGAVTRILHEYKTNNARMWFGVDNLDEARLVREVAPRHPVLVLGYTQNAWLKEAAKLGAHLTVYNWETLKVLKSLALYATSYKLHVHVKVETGTTRQGITEVEVVEFVKSLKKLKGVAVEGISTHFANIEDTMSPGYAKLQLARYNSVIMRLKRARLEIPLRHTACTAATLLYPETYGNLVRVGIGLYGLWPSDAVRRSVIPSHSTRVELGAGFHSVEGSHTVHRMRFLHSPRGSVEMTKPWITFKPVLTWKTIVAQVKEVKKGTPISYGLTERVKRNSRVAVLPVGYWDGYARGLSRIGYVLIQGTRCKVLGRVCMNMTMVDVADVDHVKPEDEVVLIGRQSRGLGDKPRAQVVSADELAQKLGTINYEVVTRINPLLPRYVT